MAWVLRVWWSQAGGLLRRAAGLSCPAPASQALPNPEGMGSERLKKNLKKTASERNPCTLICALGNAEYCV